MPIANRHIKWRGIANPARPVKMHGATTVNRPHRGLSACSHKQACRRAAARLVVRGNPIMRGRIAVLLCPYENASTSAFFFSFHIENAARQQIAGAQRASVRMPIHLVTGHTDRREVCPVMATTYDGVRRTPIKPSRSAWNRQYSFAPFLRFCPFVGRRAYKLLSNSRFIHI